MNTRTRLTTILAMVLMLMAVLAPASVVAGQLDPSLDESDMTMRAFASSDFGQIMVAMELDTGSRRMADTTYDYLSDPDYVEQEMDIEIRDTYVANRSENREVGVDQMTAYSGFNPYDDTFMMVVVASDGIYVYMFLLSEVTAGSSNGQLDTDAMYELLVDTGEWLLESVPEPAGWMDITELIEDEDVLPGGTGI